MEELFKEIIAFEFEIFNCFSEPVILNDLFDAIKDEARSAFFNDSNKVVNYNYHNNNDLDRLIILNQNFNSFSACSESVQKYLE